MSYEEIIELNKEIKNLTVICLFFALLQHPGMWLVTLYRYVTVKVAGYAVSLC